MQQGPGDSRNRGTLPRSSQVPVPFWPATTRASFFPIRPFIGTLSQAFRSRQDPQPPGFPTTFPLRRVEIVPYAANERPALERGRQESPGGAFVGEEAARIRLLKAARSAGVMTSHTPRQVCSSCHVVNAAPLAPRRARTSRPSSSLGRHPSGIQGGPPSGGISRSRWTGGGG